jgi:hypothetical protein
VTLFHQIGRKVAEAAACAPHSAAMHRLGTAVQPDMRAVTCLAMTERITSPAESPGAAACFLSARVHVPSTRLCVLSVSTTRTG